MSRHRLLLVALLPVHLALGLMAWSGPLPWWPFAVAVGGHLLVLGWGALDLAPGIYLRAYRSGRPGTLALTYDDGPHPEHTPALLDLLKAEGVQAAFFCIGRSVERHPELVRRMVAEGHLVGCHSMDHPLAWGFIGVERSVEQILRGVDAIERACGMRTTWFRPPFGVTSPHVAAAVRRAGVRVAGWDVRPFDTTFRTTEKRLAWIFGSRPKGTVVVLHDTVGPVVETTRAIITRCRAAGIPLLRMDRSFGTH